MLIKTAKSNDRGSVAVECALSIPLLVLLLLVVIQFMLLCVEQKLMTYTAFMAARSRMVRTDAYQQLAMQIVPWANAREIHGATTDALSVQVKGHKAIFNLNASPLVENYTLTATAPVYPHSQRNVPEEDNPICSGGAQC
jgi:Flp pilus assembly protein TadG